jgi:hypothetical protein
MSDAKCPEAPAAAAAAPRWASLPEDVLRGVGERLPPEARAAAAAVCAGWADACLKWRTSIRCRGGVFRASVALGGPIDPLEKGAEVVLEGVPAGVAVSLRRAEGGEGGRVAPRELEAALFRVLVQGALPCGHRGAASRGGAGGPAGWVPSRVSLTAAPSDARAAGLRELSALVRRSGLPGLELALSVPPRSRTKNLWGRVGGALGGYSGVACSGQRCSCAVARSLARNGSGAHRLERLEVDGVAGSLGAALISRLGPAAADLALANCQLEDADLWRLAGLPALRSLDASHNPRLGFGGLVALGLAPGLTRLSLRWTKLPAAALPALLLLPALLHLDVSANLWVSEECGPLRSARLESLNLASCFLEDDDASEMLGPRAELPALAQLDVSDNYLGGLDFARGLRSLTSLDARGNLADPCQARRTLGGLARLDLRGNVC